MNREVLVTAIVAVVLVAALFVAVVVLPRFRAQATPTTPAPVVRATTWRGNERIVTVAWRAYGIDHWMREWYREDGKFSHREEGTGIPPALDRGEERLGGGTEPTDEEKKAKAAGKLPPAPKGDAA